MSADFLSADKSWREYYQKALFEVDRTRLAERIANARVAILARAEQIRAEPLADERRLLTSALRTLSLLEESVDRRDDAA